MTCECCPFSGTEAAENVQNLGCLPSPYDIMQMKKRTGHNWSCHEAQPGEKLKLCAGQAVWVKEMEVPVDMKQGGLISYNTWFHQGEEAALAEAGARLAATA